VLLNAAPVAAVMVLLPVAAMRAEIPALTTMLPLVRLGLPLLSATVIVCVPAVLSVMANVPTPLVNVNPVVGSTALVSVEVNFTGPV
jgi:hypothetical protein